MSEPVPLNEERIVTNERLRILGWCYYIAGGVGGLFACVFLGYALMVGALSFIPEKDWESGDTQQQGVRVPGEHAEADTARAPRRNSPAPPVILFRIVSGVFVSMTIVGWGLAGLTIYAGRCIHRRRRRVFVNVMAAYNTIWMPYGTALGVFTFLVVNSAESVRQFEETKRQGRKNPCSP